MDGEHKEERKPRSLQSYDSYPPLPDFLRTPTLVPLSDRTFFERRMGN